IFFFSSRRRHTRSKRDWSSDVCSSDLLVVQGLFGRVRGVSGFEAAAMTPPERPPNARRRPYQRSGFYTAKRALVKYGARILPGRSEERRVGKESRWGEAPHHRIGVGRS